MQEMSAQLFLENNIIISLLHFADSVILAVLPNREKQGTVIMERHKYYRVNCRKNKNWKKMKIIVDICILA